MFWTFSTSNNVIVDIFKYQYNELEYTVISHHSSSPYVKVSLGLILKLKIRIPDVSLVCVCVYRKCCIYRKVLHQYVCKWLNVAWLVNKIRKALYTVSAGHYTLKICVNSRDIYLSKSDNSFLFPPTLPPVHCLLSSHIITSSILLPFLFWYLTSSRHPTITSI